MIGFDSIETPTHDRIKVRTLRDSVYYYLRDKIIKQHIKPKQRIYEKDIAEELDLSTTPVREAFLRLAAEGYLEISEHKSVTIKSISHSELIEIYQVISVLDGYAASLALQRIDQDQLKKIQELTDKMQGFCEKGMVEEYLEINTLLHSTIWNITGNESLLNTLRNVQSQMLRYHVERLSFYSKPGIMKKSIRYHLKIAKAFAESDNENIERIVREHWNISGILDT